jgi:hypothetical protein
MCALCRRNLLTGERFRHWEPTPRAGARVVCSLCEPRAREASWVHAHAEPNRQGAMAPTVTVRLVA